MTESGTVVLEILKPTDMPSATRAVAPPAKISASNNEGAASGLSGEPRTTREEEGRNRPMLESVAGSAEPSVARYVRQQDLIIAAVLGNRATSLTRQACRRVRFRDWAPRSCHVGWYWERKRDATQPPAKTMASAVSAPSGQPGEEGAKRKRKKWTPYGKWRTTSSRPPRDQSPVSVRWLRSIRGETIFLKHDRGGGGTHDALKGLYPHTYYNFIFLSTSYRIMTQELYAQWYERRMQNHTPNAIRWLSGRMRDAHQEGRLKNIMERIRSLW